MRSESKTSVWLVAGFAVGLALKIWMLFHMGVFDMDVYYEWGRRALEIGVPRSYHGIYFPIQYQVFKLCAQITAWTGWQFFTAYKLPNLLCDCGSFFLLVLLLKRLGSNPIYALLYWLHPWFLALFSLGYVDFQIAFWILLSLWLLRSDSTRDYLLAGLPLGVAFLMKPQVQVFIVAVALFAFFRYLRLRDLRPAAMMLGPSLFFLVYEIWFIRSLPRPRYVAAQVLPASYLNVTNIMPALTAQMTNIWYPVAFFLRKPGEGVHTVSDQIHLLPYIPAKFIAAAMVVGLVGFFIFRIEQESERAPVSYFVSIFGFASLTVPFVMTSAHENHLFLGTIFLVLFSAQSHRLGTKVAIHVLLFVQFVHIYSLYGTHPALLAGPFRQTQSDITMFVYAIVSVICFVWIALALWPRPMPAKVVAT